MTREEWIGIAAMIDAAWPKAELPEATVKVWFRLLGDLDADDVRDAVVRLASTETFPPSAAELRAAAEPDVDYEDALARLRTLLRRHGWYEGRPEIDDPALARFVDAYGWRALHDIDLTDPTFRAQFRDSYRRYVRAVRADRAAGRDVDSISTRTGRPALDVVPDAPEVDDDGTSIVPREAL